jgi:integrase
MTPKKKNPSPSTWADVLHHLDTYEWATIRTRDRRYRTALKVCEFWGLDSDPGEVRQADVDRAVKHLREGGSKQLSPASLRTYIGVLGKVVSTARDLGFEIPPVNLRRPKSIQNPRLVLTEEDELLLYDNLEAAARTIRRRRAYPGAPKPSDEDVMTEFLLLGWWIKFMLGTGLRPSESFRCRPEHLSKRDPGPDGQERFLLTIPETKTGESRSIPLVGQALEAWQVCEPYKLWSLWEENDGFLRQMWTPLMNAAMTSARYTPYCLRHTYITRMVESGMPLDVLKGLVGHKNMEQTMSYVHRSEGSMFEAVEGVK